MIPSHQFSVPCNSTFQRIIKHASVMKLLLLFGTLMESTALPVLNSTWFEPDFLRHPETDTMPMNIKDVIKRQETTNSKPCYEVLCDDGRCVSDSWLCSDTNLEDTMPSSPSEYPEQWKKRSATLHYVMAVCGIILVAVLILICVCAIEDDHFIAQNYSSSYDAKYMLKKKRQSTSLDNSVHQSHNSFKVSNEKSLLSKTSTSERSDKIETLPEVKIMQTDMKC